MSDSLQPVALGEIGDGREEAVHDAPSPPVVAAQARRRVSKLVRMLLCNSCEIEYSQEALNGEDYDGSDLFCSEQCRASYAAGGATVPSRVWGRHEANRAVRNKVRTVGAQYFCHIVGCVVSRRHGVLARSTLDADDLCVTARPPALPPHPAGRQLGRGTPQY